MCGLQNAARRQQSDGAVEFDSVWRQIFAENDLGRTMLLIGSLIGSIFTMRYVIGLFSF